MGPFLIASDGNEQPAMLISHVTTYTNTSVDHWLIKRNESKSQAMVKVPLPRLSPAE